MRENMIFPIGAAYGVRAADSQCGVKWIDAQELAQHVRVVPSVAFYRRVPVADVVGIAAVA